MNPEELANEMAAARRAIAIYLKRLLAVEEKIDRFTTEKEQRWKEEQARRGKGRGNNNDEQEQSKTVFRRRYSRI